MAPKGAAWALLNLMIAILCTVFSVLLFIFLFTRNKKRNETEEERMHRMANEAARGEDPQDNVRNKKSGLLWRILSIVAGIAAPIVFLLTEDIRNPMVFVDMWSVLMVLILVVQVVTMLLLKRARNQEEEEDAAAEA